MKVLLIDDSRAARLVTAAHLLEMGYVAIEAADGNSALKLYDQDPPDLILMDVEMPGMDGYTLARKIRENENGQWVPIIFLTGRIADEDLAHGIEAGGDDYITKPVSPMVLRAKLRAMRRITEMRKRLLELSEELKSSNTALQKLSAIDGLTNIANRRSFDASLEMEWHRGMRAARPIALIIGDVDYFKRYNDSYGHEKGDQCLQRVAGALSGAVKRSTDIVARYGGEEFAVILPDATESDAMQVADRILRDIRDLKLAHKASPVASHLTMSLGVSVCVPDKSGSPSGLIRAADSALYLSKEMGRDRSSFQNYLDHVAAADTNLQVQSTDIGASLPVL